MICEIARYAPGEELVLRPYRTPGDPTWALLLIGLGGLVATLYVGAMTWFFGGFAVDVGTGVAIGAFVFFIAWTQLTERVHARFSAGRMTWRTRLGTTGSRLLAGFELTFGSPSLQNLFQLKTGPFTFDFSLAGCSTTLESAQLAMRIASVTGMKSFHGQPGRYAFSLAETDGDPMPPPAELENARFFGAIKPGTALPADVPGRVSIDIAPDVLEIRWPQSREMKWLIWIGGGVLLAMGVAAVGLVRTWPGLAATARIAAVAALAATAYLPWLCVKYLALFKPQVIVRFDDRRRMILEESYRPNPEAHEYAKVLSVVAKASGRRMAVALEFPARRMTAVYFSADADPAAAREAALAIASALAGRLGVPAFDAG